MSKRFYWVWLSIGAVAFGVVTLGLAALSQMGLSTTGYQPPVPWPFVIGAAGGVFAYWSALCWGFGLLRHKPLVSLLVVAAALIVALGYPRFDQARYVKQQAQAADAGLIGIPPDWANKTALLIWPGKEECDYDCWNLSLHMQARVVVLSGEDARAVDFSAPVDLTELAFEELVQPDGVGSGSEQVPAEVSSIDYLIVHHQQSDDFDGVFDALRPAGIAPNGFHIDALIVEVTDAEQFDLAGAQIILRLVHVSRTIAEVPFFPGGGRKLYWNHSDREANFDRAAPYFCSDASRNPQRCFDAFR